MEENVKKLKVEKTKERRKTKQRQTKTVENIGGV